MFLRHEYDDLLSDGGRAFTPTWSTLAVEYLCFHQKHPRRPAQSVFIEVDVLWDECICRFAAELAVELARLRVVLEKDVQSVKRRVLCVPLTRRVFFVEGIRWHNRDLVETVQPQKAAKRDKRARSSLYTYGNYF